MQNIFVHSEALGFILNIQGVWNIREKESTRLALPYDYTCFADGTPFEKEFFKGRLLIFQMWFFTTPYLIKPFNNLIKKFVCIANNVASQNFFLFGVIQPTFFPV